MSAAVNEAGSIASLNVNRTLVKFSEELPENAAAVTRAPVVSIGGGGGGGGGLSPSNMRPTFSRRPPGTKLFRAATASAELLSLLMTSVAVAVGLASQ